ncbi:MAG TPA: hypothetical protein DIW44_09975 [Anaerolineaceae bacterium]|nr:hypothetical protein [Anaerolineaceae bacterium]
MQKAFLNFGIISLVRRNHGLEHATINLLSKKLPGCSFAGYSDHKGFWIVGDVSTDLLLETAQQALTRMKGGERGLAIHDNCGSNFVTAGLLAGTLAWLGMLGTGNSFKKKLDRWPLLVLLVTGALIVAQPLGPKVQEHVTTLGEPGNLTVKQIVRYEREIPGKPMLHRILTAEVVHAVEETA